MAPTFRSVSNATGATTGITVAAPTGVVSGDFQFLVVMIGTGSETISATPAGWTLLGSSENTGVNTFYAYFYISTTATGSVTLTKSGTRYYRAVRLAYSDHGGYLANSYAVANFITSGTAAAITSRTTTLDDSLVIGGSMWDGNDVAVAATSTPPAGWTERYDANTGSGAEWLGVTVADVVKATAGAQAGTFTWNTASASRNAFAIVLNTGTIVKTGARTTTLAVTSTVTGGKGRVGATTTTLGVSTVQTGIRASAAAVETATALSAASTGLPHKAGATQSTTAVQSAVERVYASSTTLGVTSSVTGGRNVATTTATIVALATSSTSEHHGGSAVTTALGIAASITFAEHITFEVDTATVMAVLHSVGVYKSGGSEPPPPDIEVTTRIYVPPTRKPLRFIAQDIVTGQIKDWDVPLTNVELTYQLSGPTILRATLGPEYTEAREIGLDAWATWIHVEESGIIRASCIVQPLAISSENLEIEAAGVTRYPSNIPYMGQLSEVEIDPTEIVRRIWSHLQMYPDAQLGVTVDATATGRKLGIPAFTEPVLDANGNPTYDEVKNAEGQVISRTAKTRLVEAKPYELMWWEETDCGSEIDGLARATPFDYAEYVAWNADKTGVIHHVQLGYPRLGSRRFDLRFAEDENLLQAVFARETPDHYASQIIVRGKGEGRDSIRGYAGGRSPRRIRRVAAVTDKTIGDVTRANALAGEELRRRLAVTSISEISVDTNHDNARVGSWSLGDDILIQADIPYIGEIALWHRIVAYTWSPDTDMATLTVRRSDQFAYGRVFE